MNLLFVLSLLGCSQIQDLMGQSDAPPPVAQPAAAPAPKPKAVVTPFMAGNYAEALPDLEKALAATPTDDAAWDAVELAALRGGQSAALLDRLSADQAIGGRVDRHQALRAELALSSNRAADALTAARALEALNAGDSAALVVRAIRAGAAKPEGLPPVVEALLKAAAEADAPLTPEVEALTGARAALLRAEIKAGRGDTAGALTALSTATASGVLGWRIALARLQWESDAAAGWTAAQAAVEASTKAGDLLGAALLLDAGKLHAYRQWKPQVLADAAAAARKSAEDAGNVVAAGAFAGVQADALLHLGSPADARAAATVAAAQPGATGKWRLALASAMLGDATGAGAAAEGLSETEGRAIRDLATAMRGGTVALPSAGLTGDDAAWQALLGAGWQVDMAGAASRAAAAAQSPDLRLWGQLWSSRGAVADAPSTPAMQAENAVRAFVSAGTAGTVANPDHPYAAHWQTLLTHGTAAPGDADIAAYTRLISSVDGGFADQAGTEMNDLSAVLADWKSGPLSPVVVMDGPRAVELERLTASPSRLTADDALAMRVSWHAWRQRDEDRSRLWTHGVSPVAAGVATPERVVSLWTAVARQRAAVLAWLGGAGAYPKASAGEIDTASVELRLLPRKAGSLDDVRATIGHSALLSFVPISSGGWEALYLTDHGHTRFAVEAETLKALSDYLGSVKGGKARLASGDRVRQALLDKHADVLTGYGNYFVVGPDPLGALPVDALPEQSQGLRYLAAIRHTFYYPNFSAITPPTFEENDYTTTMLAVVGEATAAETIKRMFPDAVILQGKAATRDAWIKEAPRSRYFHFQGLAASESGGFVMPGGGTLELADIAVTPSVARTVAVICTADTAQTLARMSAFHAAGTGDFFTTGIGTNVSFNDRMSDRFWDATNKRLPIWKAVGEPRMQAAKEVDPQGDTQPGLWGGLMSAGRLQ